MKRFIYSLILLTILASCNSYVTYVDVEHKQPPIYNNSPFYVYFEQSNTIPDSAIYVGTFETVRAGSSNFGGLVGSIERVVKKNGGNLILVSNEEPLTISSVCKGKVFRVKNFERTDLTKKSLMKRWEATKIKDIEGIYEMYYSDYNGNYDNFRIKFAVVKDTEKEYLMIYLSGFELLYSDNQIVELDKTWREGDIWAYISKTKIDNFFNVRSFDFNKFLHEKATLRYDEGCLRIVNGSQLTEYTKIFPDSAVYQDLKYTLTGFAIDNDRILTCAHGVKEAGAEIYIRGINGDFSKKYLAKVEKSLNKDDLAILKLVDKSISINYTPFSATEHEKLIADEVFVLGYPMSSSMGEDIKYTNGIINSISGYAGCNDFYQVSAPIQSGNSGSPIFDINGNLFGIIRSGIPTAENVAYSLKMKNVMDFLTRNGYHNCFTTPNEYKSLSLSDKIETLKKSVFLIEVINHKRPDNVYAPFEF